MDDGGKAANDRLASTLKKIKAGTERPVESEIQYASEAERRIALLDEFRTLPKEKQREVRAATVRLTRKAPVPETPVRGSGRRSQVASRRTKMLEIDWQFWLNMRTIKLWQACALAVGIEPDQLKSDSESSPVMAKPLFADGRFSNQDSQAVFSKVLRLTENATNWMNGPIFPQGSPMPSHSHNQEVLLKEVAKFLIMAQFAVPKELQEFAGTLSEPPISGSTVQAAPMTNSAPLPHWKMRVQAAAAEHWNTLRASGANPTVHSILEWTAKWCRDNDLRTSSNINPSANYLRTHVLGAQHWKPPK